MSALKTELRPAWRNYWLGMLIVVSFLPILFSGGEEAGFFSILVLAVILGVVYKRFSWKFTIGGGRVSRHHGIISRSQQSVRIKDLRSVELNQGPIQRIFGIGNLSFYSSGSDKAEVVFIGIKDPSEWRDRIDKETDASS